MPPGDQLSAAACMCACPIKEEQALLAIQAVEAYQGAVKADAGHHAAALALAKLHLDRGEAEAGRAVCTQLLAEQPDSVQAHLLMVHLLSTEVSQSDAAWTFGCLLHLDHGYAVSWAIGNHVQLSWNEMNACNMLATLNFCFHCCRQMTVAEACMAPGNCRKCNCKGR